jgi:hypothetical protein
MSDRTVEVRTGGSRREPWSISLSTDRYTDTMHLTEGEARMLHDVLGDTLSDLPEDGTY